MENFLFCAVLFVIYSESCFGNTIDTHNTTGLKEVKLGSNFYYNIKMSEALRTDIRNFGQNMFDIL